MAEQPPAARPPAAPESLPAPAADRGADEDPAGRLEYGAPRTTSADSTDGIPGQAASMAEEPPAGHPPAPESLPADGAGGGVPAGGLGASHGALPRPAAGDENRPGASSNVDQRDSGAAAAAGPLTAAAAAAVVPAAALEEAPAAVVAAAATPPAAPLPAATMGL